MSIVFGSFLFLGTVALGCQLYCYLNRQQG